MLRGNHANCCEFATEKWLGVFMRQLSLPEVTHQVLTVIRCLLMDSPEVLNILSPQDIGAIVNLLKTNGRDSKVLPSSSSSSSLSLSLSLSLPQTQSFIMASCR